MSSLALIIFWYLPIIDQWGLLSQVKAVKLLHSNFSAVAKYL